MIEVLGKGKKQSAEGSLISYLRTEVKRNAEFERREAESRKKTAVGRNACATLSYLIRVCEQTMNDGQMISLQSHQKTVTKSKTGS